MWLKLLKLRPKERELPMGLPAGRGDEAFVPSSGSGCCSSALGHLDALLQLVWEDFVHSIGASCSTDLSPICVLCYAVYQNWQGRNAKMHDNKFATLTVRSLSILEGLACT
ncbi:hypothetical protein KSP39_PZI007093 [Platanthera zijinensis]|uniref:Uncharacterized protein n=1 Tax=Platanthera zijinensis TaxID=2320716 RepID=A0AAP0BQD8_9ASPA